MKRQYGRELTSDMNDELAQQELLEAIRFFDEEDYKRMEWKYNLASFHGASYALNELSRMRRNVMYLQGDALSELFEMSRMVWYQQ
jgi:hypothetical protein